jgi:hypothetical protein
VHTGEEVGAYATGIITSKVGAITIATQDINELDNALDVINQRPQSILSELAEKTTFREGERQGLVGIIIAAKQIEVQLSLEDDIRQQALDAISEYLLDIGDSHDNNHRALIESGFALHYIYPADAETTIVDYLIEKSNERTQQPYSRHNVSPVVTVLQQVCNMRGTIPSNLLLRGQ